MKKLLIILPFLSGCALPDNKGPATTIEINPYHRTIKFKDTKDNRLEVTDMKSKTKDGGALDIGHLVLENNASSVIREQQVMMDKYNDQLKTTGDNLDRMAARLSELANILVPGGLAPILHSPAPSNGINGLDRINSLEKAIEDLKKLLPSNTNPSVGVLTPVP